ncbi:MAG: hypothetical protein KH373_08750 [Ruminococcus sp.]|nr:hypothetical protein [Ruminococcus sp.]
MDKSKISSVSSEVFITPIESVLDIVSCLRKFTISLLEPTIYSVELPETYDIPKD